MKIPKKQIGAVLLCVIGSSNALATDGYFSSGYGVKSQGMGGVGIALPQDGLAAAYNPAGIALLDDQFNLGVTWFSPKRDAEIVGNGVPGVNGHYDGNGKKNFFIPEVGYIKKLSDSTSVGLAIYGNGGMNTDYSNNPYSAFGSSGKAGVNLEQLYIKPSIAYKLNEKNTFGAGINFVYQRFSAEGLQAFASSSSSPDNLTNKGHSSSTGLGIHLGWVGQLTKDLSVGATWSSKAKMSRFDEYKGLFADGGSFDIPETYGIGVAFKATPSVTLAADIQRINYGSVDSIANPLSNLLSGNPLGSRNGPGFGWKDITVVKVGASYEVKPGLTLRVGYNHSDQPIPNDQTLFNILAPGLVQDHLTLGGSWKTSPNGEWSVFYTHAFRKEVKGHNSIPMSFGGGEANIGLSQNIFGVAYEWKL